MRSGDTIVALSSGNLPTGVAVIRLSGPKTFFLLEKFAGGTTPPRQMVLRAIGQGDEVIDRGLVVSFPGPQSFTGEDCAELQVHGSPAVVKALLDRLTRFEAVRLAEAGEFTRRAFENGKLDLTQVEGLGDLLDAETESQRKLALSRADGAIAEQILAWRLKMIDLRAEIEARLDFSDEGDVEDELPAHWQADLAGLIAAMSEALASYQHGRVVREGFRVALAGLPNAGKSSLLNALAKSDLAIVSDEAGTTRDVREVPLDMKGQLVVLVDLAGLRDTTSDAEAQGIARARREMEKADLVLWLKAPDIADDSTELPEGITVWHVATKADIAPPQTEADYSVSARSGEGLLALMEAIGAKAMEAGSEGGLLLISHQRDQHALADALDELNRIEVLLAQPELAAEALRQASDILARLTGHIDAEMILDRLFSSFCIGK